MVSGKRFGIGGLEELSFVGAAHGAITGLTSYELRVASPASLMLDVYTSGAPAVAQITLGHFNNATAASGVIYDVQGTGPTSHPQFANAVFSSAMKRVSFWVHAGSTEDAGGTPWCQALVNIFEFEAGTKVEVSPPPKIGG